MYNRDNFLNYRCPRWRDWPQLDLYMDQAVSLIEENVRMFYAEGPLKPVTATMINNYVKNKMVPPSRRKKYGQDHLAYFFIIFLLKSALSLVDISEAIMFFSKRTITPEKYDIFCLEVEVALATAFGGELPRGRVEIEGIEIIRGLTLAFAYTWRARFYLAFDTDTRAQDNIKGKSNAKGKKMEYM